MPGLLLPAIGEASTLATRTLNFPLRFSGFSSSYRVEDKIEETLAGTDWLLTARHKSLLALRAFEVLHIHVRSLFWRDAMDAGWAGSVQDSRIFARSSLRRQALPQV